MTMPAMPRLSAYADINSPISELVRSPPPSTTMTSPGSAISIALCTMRLSPGLVLTVKAGPASGPALWIGRSDGPPAAMRDMESLILATGSSRNFAVMPGSTLRARLQIWNPITANLPCLGYDEITFFAARQVTRLVGVGGRHIEKGTPAASLLRASLCLGDEAWRSPDAYGFTSPIVCRSEATGYVFPLPQRSR